MVTPPPPWAACANDHSFGEDVSPVVQTDPLLVHCYSGEEADPHLTTISFQIQSQFPQVLPVRLVLQILHKFCCLPLNMIQDLNIFLVERDPKLNKVLKMQSLQC